MSENKEKKKVRKNTKNETFYIQPQFLSSEIKKFYDTGKMSDDLGRQILEQVKRLQSRGNFNGYTYLDEMEGDAIIKIIEVLNKKNYDLNLQTNPFTYFTTVQWNCFLARMRKEKEHNKKVHALLDSMYEELMHEPGFDEMYHLYFKKNPDAPDFQPNNSQDND